MTEPAKNILSTYLRRLTNLSGNNRSLLVLRLGGDQLVDVKDFSHLNGEPSFSLIAALIAGESKRVCPILDSRMESNNLVSGRLKKLQRTERLLFEETGSRDLHVGWPFVRGKFLDGTLIRCPLLYFPVQLLEEGQHWVIRPRKDAGITLNKSFFLAFSFFNDVQLDEELIETNFEEFDTDSTVFRTQLYQLLKDKIEINFNAANFQDELESFRIYKRDEFDQEQRAGELKLFPEAVLGIFPQAGSQLVPDYLSLMEDHRVPDLDAFFTSKAIKGIQPNGSASEQISEENIYTPFSLDAWQEQAIHAVKNGRSIVVQGPPGTGKSQLICNLLADAIASGRKALLVCQKRAALDVVYARLKDMGLADFLGLVHDFRNDRKTIFQKIGQQIEAIEEFKARNRSIDAIQTERKFFQLCRRLDQVRDTLEEFKFALFDDKECGVSVKELYLTSDIAAETINIKQEYQYFPFSDVSSFLRRMKAYAMYASALDYDHSVWSERKSFADLSVRDQAEIEKIIVDIPKYQEQISREVDQLLGIGLNVEDCISLHHKEDDILGMISVLKDDDVYRYFQAMSAETDDDTSLVWLANLERVTLSCFAEEMPEVSLPLEQLGTFIEVLHQCTNARRKLIPWIKWELAGKEKFLVKRVLVANDLGYNTAGLTALERRVDSRLNLEHNLTELRNRPWLIEIPPGYDKSELRTWFEKQKLAMRAKLVFNTLREITGVLNVHRPNRQAFIALFRNLLGVIKEVPDRRKMWYTYLSPFQVKQLVLDPARQSEYLAALRLDFDNLCEYDKLNQELKDFERDVVIRLRDSVGGWRVPDMEERFLASLRLAWIDHIETKYPILRSVSSMKMDELQQQLQASVEEKRTLSKEILLLRARERVCENIEYNRVNNQVTYRDLRHQVTKKKKIWPIRKLFAAYHYELFQLMPCWMASPESVSAIFPMTELFDIVIFDEASQCFAERGLPAIFRGKQVVIAGDDKQLKPSELYQVRWEDEEENPDTEVDSLLELAGRYLETVHLQGHYRSKALELIEFSNVHFYNGRLQLLPDRELLNGHVPAIEYQKVAGVWNNQTNDVEADAVVRRVIQLLKDHPEKDMGVVTFNASQQMLILDKLEATAKVEGMELPPSLFVKNIENVQGDEKDIIIFSVGYAPDKQGKMAMQFGSLNTAGGENRLNVAVTRARERIIVVTSVMPEKLRVAKTKGDGPRILRKYLEYAWEVDQRQFRPRAHYTSGQSADWYLNNRLKKWGDARLPHFDFEVNGLPYADISVQQEGKHIGLILTDDSRYFTSVSVKDVHAYTPALLSLKRWKYHMVYSRNFWKDRQRVEEELMLFAGSRGSGGNVP